MSTLDSVREVVAGRRRELLALAAVAVVVGVLFGAWAAHPVAVGTADPGGQPLNATTAVPQNGTYTVYQSYDSRQSSGHILAAFSESPGLVVNTQPSRVQMTHVASYNATWNVAHRRVEIVRRTPDGIVGMTQEEFDTGRYVYRRETSNKSGIIQSVLREYENRNDVTVVSVDRERGVVVSTIRQSDGGVSRIGSVRGVIHSWMTSVYVVNKGGERRLVGGHYVTETSGSMEMKNGVLWQLRASTVTVNNWGYGSNGEPRAAWTSETGKMRRGAVALAPRTTTNVTYRVERGVSTVPAEPPEWMKKAQAAVHSGA